MDRGESLARWVLIASAVAGVSYIVSWSLPLPAAASIAWKGAGVGLLAVYAGLKAKGLFGWMICAVMALGALGDVLLNAVGLEVGAIAFLAGHVVAIALYLRNRRPKLTSSQRLLALVLIPTTVVIAFALPGDRSGAPLVALYALGLSLMAATAWTSRFPRLRVGLGALMFVASDLLIFAETGPLRDAAWTGLAIWMLYYFGQFQICLGVTRTLERDRPA